MSLKRPCDDCPFLRGSMFEDSMCRERAEEIAQGLQAGGMFSCHKTTADGGAPGGDEQWCAGALGTMENEGVVMENQMVRIAGRLGEIGDPAELDGLLTLYDELDEWVDMHEELRWRSPL